MNHVGINQRQLAALKELQLDRALLKLLRNVSSSPKKFDPQSDLVIELIKMGFERRETSDGYDRWYFMVHEARKLVIKYQFYSESDPLPERAVTTYYVVQTSKSYRLAVQRLVDTSEAARKRAYNEINNMPDRRTARRLFGWDTHPYNVGLLDGEPVVFDW